MKTWAVRGFGRQLHSFVRSGRDNLSRPDLFVALSINATQAYSRRDLGFQGTSNVSDFQTQHSGNEVGPRAQSPRCCPKPLSPPRAEASSESLRIAMSEASTREPLFHVTVDSCRRPTCPASESRPVWFHRPCLIDNSALTTKHFQSIQDTLAFKPLWTEKFNLDLVGCNNPRAGSRPGPDRHFRIPTRVLDQPTLTIGSREEPGTPWQLILPITVTCSM